MGIPNGRHKVWVHRPTLIAVQRVGCDATRSMSMGIPGQLDHPRIAEAMDTVLKATRAKGLIAGIHLVHPDTAVTQVADRLKEGYQFIALGTDILFLGDACRDLHDRVRRTIDGGS